MTKARIRRWGKLPEEVLAFEFGGLADAEFSLREAVICSDRVGYSSIEMINEDGKVGGYLKGCNFYKPLTRAARELHAWVKAQGEAY